MKFIINSGENKQVTLTEPGEYIVELIGAGARAEIFGAFTADQSTQMHVSLHVIHKAAHTSAQTTLRGVARDHAQVHFFGRIKIEPNCPDVQSFLEERVLLLSDHAKAEAVPELEILSDDVKCSHAASVSSIPQEKLFYLQSRGITKQASEKLIVAGFLTRMAKD